VQRNDRGLFQSAWGVCQPQETTPEFSDSITCLLAGLALRVSEIGLESRGVELRVDGVDLAGGRIHVEDDHAVDAQGVRTNAGRIPLPGDLVAGVE